VGSYNTLSKKTKEQLNKEMVKVDFVSEYKLTNQDFSLFDALLIEYNPNIISLINKIQAAKNHGYILPRLILTGHFHPAAMAVAMKSGVDEFLAKPLGTKAIIAFLEKTIKQ
jgi:FixJ family two-component response regulator